MSWTDELARMAGVLRRRGASSLVAERWDRWARQRLLRRHVFPRVHAAQLRALGRAAARSARASRPGVGAGTVRVVASVDSEGPKTTSSRPTWKDVELDLVRVFSDSFRQSYPDTAGGGPVVSWFVVDWVDADHSSAGLDLGHHRIFDVYRRFIDEASTRGMRDELHWHYHHAPRGRAEVIHRDWSEHPVYEEILSRKVLERGYWPVVYRAGNTWEDNEVSRWLEQWVPFDLSNRAPFRNVHYDWSRAPQDWDLYHPSATDVQRPGGQRRLMGRSLDVDRGEFVRATIEPAFVAAREGNDSYVSFYTHDFQELEALLRRGFDAVKEVAAHYPEVRWQHCGALELFRQLGHVSAGSPPRLSLARKPSGATIETADPVYARPWVAARYAQLVMRLDAHPRGPTRWSVDWPDGLGEPDECAVAVSSPDGHVAVQKIPCPESRR